MISCKKAVELISKAQEETLSLAEELTLKIHLFICEFCEQYKKQLAMLRKMTIADRDEKNSTCPPLSSAAKESIKDKIRKAQDT